MKYRTPDFENVLTVCRRGIPARPVLFELFMNTPLYRKVTGELPDGEDRLSIARFTARAYEKLGYDYVTLHASDFHFRTTGYEILKTQSLNEGGGIVDEESFEKYPWNEPEDFDDSVLGRMKPYLPDGMKIMVMGPGGVLENVIQLTGYDNLCYMLYDDPELCQRIFDAVGTRLIRYYQSALQYDTVGLISSNDDWGFNTQTLLSPEMMRRYVFPWHRKIVETVHAAGRPVFLHSCGNLRDVTQDIYDMGYDAKHSFEDNILPIEEAYEQLHDHIAVFGGIDMNYICTRSPEEVYRRTAEMLERTRDRGGWAVGTGNSIPEYVPLPQYGAMLKAALGYNPLTE